MFESSDHGEHYNSPSLSCVWHGSINTFGLGMALVMKYTVDEINANSTLLPDIRLGYEIFDTCKQSAVIVKPTLFFLTEGSSRELAIMCNYTDYVTRVVAVIGPSTSEMVSVIGKLLGFFLMPQVCLVTCWKVVYQCKQ